MACALLDEEVGWTVTVTGGSLGPGSVTVFVASTVLTVVLTGP